jgi:hypothetical protein
VNQNNVQYQSTFLLDLLSYSILVVMSNTRHEDDMMYHLWSFLKSKLCNQQPGFLQRNIPTKIIACDFLLNVITWYGNINDLRICYHHRYIDIDPQRFNAICTEFHYQKRSSENLQLSNYLRAHQYQNPIRPTIFSLPPDLQLVKISQPGQWSSIIHTPRKVLHGNHSLPVVMARL